MVNVVYCLPTDYGSGQLAWYKGRQPPALFLHSSREPSKLSPCFNQDDSAITIIVVIIKKTQLIIRLCKILFTVNELETGYYY